MEILDKILTPKQLIGNMVQQSSNQHQSIEEASTIRPYSQIINEKKQYFTSQIIPYLEQILASEFLPELTKEYKDLLIKDVSENTVSYFWSKSYDFLKLQRRKEKEELDEINRLKYLESLKPKTFDNIEQFRDFVLTRWQEIVYNEDSSKVFKLDDFIKPTFNKLLHYFYGEAEKVNLHQHKPILLIGNIGSRKTTIMEAFSDNPIASFRIIPAKKITTDFREDGEYYNDFLNNKKIYYRNIFSHTEYDYLIDDFGREDRSVVPKKRSFSETPTNFFKDFFSERKTKHRPHITANFDDIEYQNQLTQLYDGSIASRIIGSYNIIKLAVNSPDYRISRL